MDSGYILYQWSAVKSIHWQLEKIIVFLVAYKYKK